MSGDRVAVLWLNGTTNRRAVTTIVGDADSPRCMPHVVGMKKAVIAATISAK